MMTTTLGGSARLSPAAGEGSTSAASSATAKVILPIMRAGYRIY